MQKKGAAESGSLFLRHDCQRYAFCPNCPRSPDYDSCFGSACFQKYFHVELYNELPRHLDLSLKVLSTFNFKFKVSGEKQNIIWSIDGELPEGLSFSRDGRIFGFPQSTGVYSIMLRVFEDNMCLDTGYFKLVVEERRLSSIRTGNGSFEK